MIRLFGAVIFGLVGTTLAMASAPKELYGKSIVVTWGETRTQRQVGEAAFRQVQAGHNFSIYVSSAGRVFSRLTNTMRAGTGKTEQVAGTAGATRVPTFGKQSMTVFQPFAGRGMRRINVEFDGSYATCNAKVIHAKLEGTGSSIAFSPITKKNVEFQSASASGERCAIRSGNPFGNE